MSRGWVEIWTRPGSASFEAVIVDPPIQSASFTRTLSGIGRGELVLPADYDRVDEIILTDLATPANNVRTLVRVFLDDGTATPVVAYEFYADQLERVEGPDNLVSITGPGVESAMGDARVEPYDWDGTANFVSQFPDWVWGGIDVMRSITVSGLARVPDVWEIGTDGTGGTFTLTLNGNPTAAIAYNASYNALEGAVQATDLGNVDAVVDGGEGTIDQPWRLAINLPPDGNSLTADFTGVTGDTEQVFAQVQVGGYDGANIDGWTVAQFADSRATPQLFGTYGNPPLAVSTTSLPSGATYRIRVNGASQFAGTQKVMNVIPGGLYHARLTFRTPSGTDQFRIVVRDPVADGEATPIAAFPSGGGQFTVTANTVTSIDLDGIVIPEGTNQIIFRIAYVGTGDPDTFDVFPELSYFREGQPPSTFGDIMIQLLEDADGTDHPAREVWRDAADSFTWVDYSSFTDALDSNGNAWQDTELSVTVKRGKPYDKVLADFVGLGYEWELIPDTANPGVWLLNLYNSDGIGTDRTALATPQIFGEESVGGARMYRRHPPASNVAVEGSSQLSARISSVGAVTAYGLRESYVPDLDITTLADAGLKATQTISAYLRKSQPLTLARQPRDVDPFPFVNFQLGDTVNVSEPPFMEKDGRRLVQVVWALTAEGETVAESYGAVTYTGQAAVNQGVYQLLDRFEPIRQVDGFQPVTAGAGGVIPWLVAAEGAPESVKAVAGWQCSGVADEAVINAALLEHDMVLLSFGNFNIDNDPIVVPTGHRLEGVGGQYGSGSYLLVNGTLSVARVIDCVGAATIASVAILGDTGYTGIYSDGSVANIAVRDCFIERCDIGIDLVGCDEIWISDNLFFLNDQAIVLTGVDRGVLRGNMSFAGSGPSEIDVTNSTFVRVEGNIVVDAASDGIELNGSSDCVVAGNVVAYPVRDALVLAGDSNRNQVAGNAVTPLSATTRYGVNVSAATCDNNLICDNWLGDASEYATGSYNDAGTGTITTRDANGQFTY
jgi:parallel beta-helix repeat protein